MADTQDTTTTEAPPEFDIHLSGDKMSLLVTAPDAQKNPTGNAVRIGLELPALELAVEVGNDVLEELLIAACESGEPLVDYPLLTGDPPQPPRDGEVQWQEDFFASGFICDDDSGRIDYWERAEKRAVTEDQLVAVVLLPVDGKPGRTLQGNDVAVPKPKPARLRNGKGVRAEELDDRIHLYAAVSGRITFKDGTVTVDDVYTIRGDVGIETGNINHSGALVVQGDVKEGARIECEGDVLIKGMVEPCDISCGNNLTVGGGIIGDEEHRIDVVGTVQARYLNEVTLRCGSDVTVISQIDHSHVETLGKIDIPKGRIAGGEVTAYKGIQTGHAGASSATGTKIMAGVDWRLVEKQRDRRSKMVQLQEIREKLQQTIDHAVATGTYDDAQRAKIEEQKAKIAKIDKALEAESEAQEKENAESVKDAVREVSVLIALWSGVSFQLGTSKVISDRSYDLPRLVTLRRDKARILPMGEQNTPE